MQKLIKYIATAAGIYLVMLGMLGGLGLLILGFSALKAALDMPIWVPLAFLALVSLAGAAAERSGK